MGRGGTRDDGTRRDATGRLSQNRPYGGDSPLALTEERKRERDKEQDGETRERARHAYTHARLFKNTTHRPIGEIRRGRDMRERERESAQETQSRYARARAYSFMPRSSPLMHVHSPGRPLTDTDTHVHARASAHFAALARSRIQTSAGRETRERARSCHRRDDASPLAFAHSPSRCEPRSRGIVDARALGESRGPAISDLGDVYVPRCSNVTRNQSTDRPTDRPTGRGNLN